MLVNRYATLNSVDFLLILPQCEERTGETYIIYTYKIIVYNERSDWLKAINYSVISNVVNQSTVCIF